MRIEVGIAIIASAVLLASCEKEGPLEPVQPLNAEVNSSVPTVKDRRMLLCGMYAGSHHYVLYNGPDIQFETTYSDTVSVRISSATEDSLRIFIDGSPADVFMDWSLSIGPEWWGWGAGQAYLIGSERQLNYFFHASSFPHSEEHSYSLHRI